MTRPETQIGKFYLHLHKIQKKDEKSNENEGVDSDRRMVARINGRTCPKHQHGGNPPQANRV